MIQAAPSTFLTKVAKSVPPQQAATQHPTSLLKDLESGRQIQLAQHLAELILRGLALKKTLPQGGSDESN